MARFSLRKSLRQYIAKPRLQPTFRVLYRIALAGMNYGGAGSALSAGDDFALRYLRRHHRGKSPVVFDVGANIGSYLQQVVEILGDNFVAFAFEPSGAAFGRLEALFEIRSNVHLVRAGLGEKSGTATLWSTAPGSVLASTFVNPLATAATPEQIEILALDEFCVANNVEHIDLLKLDLEGGELDALKGARTMLEHDAVDLIQFEFGQSNLGARTFFLDLFHMLDASYEIFRILPAGLARIRAYHETLEVFMSTNYLAVSRGRPELLRDIARL